MLRDKEDKQDKQNSEDREEDRWVQGRPAGQSVFNEGLVAIVDKDLYSRSSPSQDKKLFEKYAPALNSRS